MRLLHARRPSGRAPGWQYSEYDGEMSYANSLLTTLAQGTSPSVLVTSGLLEEGCSRS